MLFAPALTDRVILPSARGGRYFFNRIGQKLTLESSSFRRAEPSHRDDIRLSSRLKGYILIPIQS